MRYIGEYRNGVREGKGKVLRRDGSLAIEGEFKNDLPNGKGMAPNSEKVLNEVFWVDGLDSRLLPDSK